MKKLNELKIKYGVELSEQFLGGENKPLFKTRTKKGPSHYSRPKRKKKKVDNGPKRLTRTWAYGKNIDFGFRHKLTIREKSVGDRKVMTSAKDYSNVYGLDKMSEEQLNELITGKYERNMRRLMDSRSLKNWEALKNDPDNVQFAIAAVAYFIESTTGEWTAKKFNAATGEQEDSKPFKRKWETIKVGRKVDVKKLPIPGIELPPIKDTKEPGYDPYDFTFPQGVPPSNLFANNEYCLAAANDLKNAVDTLIRQVRKQMELYNPPPGAPPIAIMSLNIKSSCSRYRNQKPKTCPSEGATGLSFKELSQKRSKTAYNYILKQIQQQVPGAVFHEEFKPNQINWKGENGDGSSGPNPPNGNRFVAKGVDVPMTPFCEENEDACDPKQKSPSSSRKFLGQSEKKKGNFTLNRNECGTPHSKSKDYAQHRYVIADIRIIFNDLKDIEEDPQNKMEDNGIDGIVTEIPTKNYPITFIMPPKPPVYIKLPALKFHFRGKADESSQQAPKKVPGSVKCEAFGTGFGD